jgi:hypothetical protein
MHVSMDRFGRSEMDLENQPCHTTDDAQLDSLDWGGRGDPAPNLVALVRLGAGRWVPAWLLAPIDRA